MFRSPTVFVLGAGSSVEVGLPLGSSLRDKVAGQLDFGLGTYDASNPVHAAMLAESQRVGYPNIDKYITACGLIRNAMPQAISIDNYLNMRQDDPNIKFCGKLAIANSIIEAECSSDLAFPPR